MPCWPPCLAQSVRKQMSAHIYLVVFFFFLTVMSGGFGTRTVKPCSGGLHRSLRRTRPAQVAAAAVTGAAVDALCLMSATSAPRCRALCRCRCCLLHDVREELAVDVRRQRAHRGLSSGSSGRRCGAAAAPPLFFLLQCCFAPDLPLYSTLALNTLPALHARKRPRLLARP